MKLRANTATTITIGQLVDASDGVTPETAVAAGTVDQLAIAKHAATSLVDISGTTTLTHIAGGVYSLTLSASNLDTVGRLDVILRDDDVCLPFILSFDVLAETVYDAAFGKPAAVIGTVDTATNAHAPTVTEFQADDVDEATADHYAGRRIRFTSGALLGQSTVIVGYQAVGGIGQFTVLPMTEAPANNDTFVIEL